ncbi:SusC/RagA family TonB-linked outer membrane protein [Thermophagus sp. OGC60D27]|uniref:SusC/RagA family TonB-linked outer membrane protein n=1 Tax=Thermophagus sp. OGC60D27 TaxID=3458415 RepID=UPI004037A45C
MKRNLQLFLAMFLFAFQLIAFGQEKLVTGNVIDETGTPLPGVSIVIQGTTSGTVTDMNGHFTIRLKEDQNILRFSFIGFKNQIIEVGNQTELNIQMVPQTRAIDEVVVIGYGTMRKSDVTGSVSSVSVEDLKEIAASNVDQMLQGRLAGVQVTQNSGAPGGAASIRIRGASSINSSNEPLYIIDGVRFNGDGDEIGGFSWAGGSNGQNKVNPLSTISPSDIISMDVLKDASATAIYGAAGANGVVIINTRQGEKGSVKINYNGYYAIQKLAKKLDMMNLRQYAQYQNELSEFTGTEVDEYYKDPSILGTGTDWQDEIFREAPMQSHQISISGGSDNLRFAASGGYLNQDGIIFGSGFKRYNTRLKAEGKVNDWISMGGTIAFSHTDEIITRQDGTDGVIMQALTMQPSIPVYNFDGTYAGPNDVNGASQYNPVWLAKMQNNTLVRNRTMGNLFLDLDILPDLNFRTEFGYDISNNKNLSFIPTYDFGLISSDLNKMLQREDHSIFWLWKNFLTYTHTFAEKHSINLMAGAETSKSAWDGNQLIKQNFSTDDIYVMTTDGDFVSNSGWKDEATTASVFGRLNYNFDERYLVTGTLRADGSSKFGSNNKWGYFPSAAVAWRVSQEAFMEDLSVVSNLKLRLGYGKVGNSNIGTYRYGSTMYTMSTPMGTAYRLSNIPNPNLKWEASEQYNAGIDLGLWGGRISLTVDLYQKESEDLLMQVSIPSYLGDQDSYNGIAAPFVNIGKTRNKGFDISVNTVNFERPSFRWMSDFIISVNKNEVVELNDDSQIIFGNLDWWSEFQTATAIMVGKSMGVYYGYKVDRLFTSEQDILEAPVQVEDPSTPKVNLYNQKTGVYVGDIKFKDLNGDGYVNDKDQTVIGDPNPDFTFGINNTFSYKNIELAIGINGSYGSDILNFSRFRTESMTSIWDNQAKRVTQRAIVGKDSEGNAYLTNPQTTIPRPATNDFNRNNRMSDRWIEDGSYLRISNIKLGYNIPSHITGFMGIRSAKVYITLQNIYTWTNYSGYDPEVGAYNQSSLYQNIDMGRYPSPRIYTFGVNIGF